MKFFTKLGSVSLLMVFLVVIATAGISQAQQSFRLDDGTFVIDNFEQQPVGSLPTGWYNRNGDHKVTQLRPSKRVKYHYTIVKNDSNKFLRYSGVYAMHLNFPFINKQHENVYNINVYETPILSWKWRVFNLPNGANIHDNGSNDAAASIYVVWGFGHILFKKVPKTVRYVWGTAQSEGTVMSKLFGNQKIVVVESGPANKGEWVTFHRNIVKDYKRLFGDKPPKTPLAILILSDGDSTNSYVKADYDDIKLEPATSVGNGE